MEVKTDATTAATNSNINLQKNLWRWRLTNDNPETITKIGVKEVKKETASYDEIKQSSMRKVMNEIGTCGDKKQRYRLRWLLNPWGQRLRNSGYYGGDDWNINVNGNPEMLWRCSNRNDLSINRRLRKKVGGEECPLVTQQPTASKQSCPGGDDCSRR